MGQSLGALRLMDDELYPPGMSPRKNPPGKTTTQQPGKTPPGSGVKPPLSQAPQRTPAPLRTPAAEDEPGDGSEFDATELPDEFLPEAALPPAAIESPAESPLVQRTGMGRATEPSADSTSTLRLSTAPKAAQLARRRDKSSAAFLLITVASCVTLLVVAAAAYVKLGRRSIELPMVAERGEPSSPTAQSPVVRQPQVNARRNPVESGWSAAPAPSLDVTDSANTETSTDQTPATGEAAMPDATASLPLSAPSTPSAPAQPKEPSPEPPPKVTRAEVQQLIKALENTKTALGEQNFKMADTELKKAASLARLPSHQAAVARLQEIRGYIEQFQQAIAAAAGKLQAGESFKVGNSTQVSFVDAKKDKITLRIAGMNKTYPLNDLPPGLALALVDFTLPPTDVRSKLLKGAYLVVHKRADSETEAKARGLWEDAKSSGRDVSHLMPLLDENYEALLKDASD